MSYTLWIYAYPSYYGSIICTNSASLPFSFNFVSLRHLFLLPPRPVHDEVELANAMEMIDRMARFKSKADQEDYLEAISTFVEAYEAARFPFPIDNSQITPLEALKTLLAEHGMNTSDLEATERWVVTRAAGTPSMPTGGLRASRGQQALGANMPSVGPISCSVGARQTKASRRPVTGDTGAQ